MTKEIRPIAHVRTCYGEKFGVPRQSGLVAEAEGRVVFEPDFRQEEALRRIEEFSHLWLIFDFHQAPWDGALTVRPPRLGGNERVGVFATRSPFRPNGLGLSVVKLLKVEREGDDSPSLLVSGVDLVDGTPLYDVKPYIPYADALPDAEGGYANARPAFLKVEPTEEIADHFRNLNDRLQQLIVKTLSCDPRPATHGKEGRSYGCLIEGFNVRWQVEGETCCIISIEE